MSKINSVVLCVALTLPVMLGGCVAPLAIQALAGLSGVAGQSSPFSFSSLSKQLDSMTKSDVAQAPQERLQDQPRTSSAPAI